MKQALLLLAIMPTVAAAQSSPQLVEAMRLSGEGRSDSARRIVAAVLARSRPGDSLYVEALYSRGRLAASADTAERDLRRVAIEYSTSRWADDAMLQLAQLALAAGNAPSALAQVQRLRADFPGSELRPQAAYWGARASFVTGDNPSACALLDSARAEAAGDVEFQNQVSFYRARCLTVVSPSHPRAPPAEDATPLATPTPTPAQPTPAPAQPSQPTQPTQPSQPTQLSSGYEVQVGAPRDSEVAARIAARFTREGLAAHVRHDPDGYFRVRLGPFATLQQARDAAARAQRFMPAGERPFVVRP